jgi:hypothetical protein
MFKKLFFAVLVLGIIASCKSGSDGRPGTEFEIPDSVIYANALEISTEVMSDIISNVSSPVEMAALIKSIGVPFTNQYLATTANVDNYNTNFKRAFNLGIFGADLGYLNMYNRTTSVLDYITAIRRLADGLAVGQFFDFNTLRRLASSQQNLDSLMYISVHSFNQMDNYLRQEKRGHLSALMVTGVWVEGLYILTQVSNTYPNSDLTEKIGEQKIILNDLMIILKNYQRAYPQFSELVTDLEKIKKTFDPVKIRYEIGEPEAVEKDGMLMIIQNERSIVEITDDQLNEIIRVTEEIRNKLIQ